MEATKKSSVIPFINKVSTIVNLWSPFILLAIAVIIILPQLGMGSLRDWDEAIYAQISREMIQSGDWITLHFGYKPFFEKPPLLMWLTALFFRFFGVSEFWSRAVSAISGTLLVLVTYFTGREIYDSRTGFLAGLILLGSYGFVFEARNGETDMLLSLVIFTGIFAYLRLKTGGQRWWYLIWISCALAFMVKFWAGLVLPAGLAIVLLLEQRIAETLRLRQFWLGILLMLAMVIPWHLLVYLQNGKSFIDVYIGRDLLERTLTAMEGHYGTPFFYLDALRRSFSPWYFLFPFALALAVQEILDRNQKIYAIFVQTLLIFGLYTFIVNTKNPSYIFPLVPSLAILTARLFSAAWSPSVPLTFPWLVTASLIATTIIQDKLLFFCVILLLGLLVFLKLGLVSKAILFPMITSLVFTVFFTTSIIGYVLGNYRLRVLPIYGMQISPVSQIAILTRMQKTAVDNPLICFALEEDWDTNFAVEGPAALFYSNRPIDKVISWDQLKELMSKKKSGEILIAKRYLPRLSEDFDVLVIEEVDPLVYARIDH